MGKKKANFADSRIPLYYQLENVLREKITSGAFQGGERLPTEIELIEEYGVSRITVRQALQALSEDGLIERKQGRGTYVSARNSRKRKSSNRIHLTGSLDELIALGMDAPVEVLEMNRVEADTHEAESLGIEVGTKIYRLKRLSLNDEKPHSLITNYLPEEIGKKLTMEELSSGALLYAVEKKLGYTLDNARQEIRAELADPYVSKLLDVRVGTALLSTERTVYTDQGQPVEFVHTLHRSDIYGYSVKFVREEK
ncbi:MAG: GntR family transcriptional regulator [Pyrinomonadaceae bacterium]|nr:GntR family transcriptional regulator [Pyrinomonadaceae bacterium]